MSEPAPAESLPAPEPPPNTALPALPPILYRPNVAAILENAAGEVLVAERVGIKGAWQFPQGGVDSGEDFESALYRELEEEVGVGAHLVELLESRSGYRYAFPKGRLKYGIYGGQEQTYYRCRFLGRDSDIRLDKHQREFSRWRWISPALFQLSWVPKFKRHVYHQLFKDFYQMDLLE
jgi:putative (di)nucleoside polyphosphate hydrolase